MARERSLLDWLKKMSIKSGWFSELSREGDGVSQRG